MNIYCSIDQYFIEEFHLKKPSVLPTSFEEKERMKKEFEEVLLKNDDDINQVIAQSCL
ncbi:hypothetical protein KM1_004070 [Entamoeba histolytica HM-3:IMSS]|uniref:Uncharacterized protein n=2 Tax=Entamoeba TaxID=5758 RepID=M7VV86_ENTHI|nr:hypothetical protein KM1_004070 [Entamoeba histolytica HM-3:IMSS]